MSSLLPRRLIIYFKFNFIEVELIYNVVLVSDIQYSDSLIVNHIFICMFFFPL